jgi:hypothetical protein
MSGSREFARHFGEMIVAMLAGMVVLGGAGQLGLLAAGIDLEYDAPALALLGMALVMTVPMVAWMRHRGHGWAPCYEMAAAMFVPSFAAIGLLTAGAGGLTTAYGVQHAAMIPAMLGAMLLRHDEYTRHHLAVAE